MQNFPSRAITLITAAAAGGSADIASRIIAHGLSSQFGWTVDVENRGAGAVACADEMMRAPPDGHTLFVSAATLWTAPLLEKVSYDAMRDFAPVTLAITQPNVLVVNPALGVHSVNELIDLVRQRPGEFSYGSGLAGTPSHLAGALFTHLAHLNMKHVAYKNTARLGVGDLLAGKIHMMIFSAGSGMPHVKAGRLRALAVTSAQPSLLLPDLPPIAATLPGYDAAQPIGIFAPVKTPTPVIQRLNHAMAEVLNTPDAQERLLRAGMEAVANSPEQFANYIASDIENMRAVVDGAHIQAP